MLSLINYIEYKIKRSEDENEEKEEVISNSTDKLEGLDFKSVLGMPGYFKFDRPLAIEITYLDCNKTGALYDMWCFENKELRIFATGINYGYASTDFILQYLKHRETL